MASSSLIDDDENGNEEEQPLRLKGKMTLGMLRRDTCRKKRKEVGEAYPLNYNLL